MTQTAGVRIDRQQVKRIDALTRAAEELERELRDLIRAHPPELITETGHGTLYASILIAQTAGAERFATGVAPIPATTDTTVTVSIMAAAAGSTAPYTSSPSPAAA